ncbi:MAG: hypothetical protein H6931_03235 [Burkholderiaceae bacterium]|nr:hypothetical protein [Burkholderiaceae bacterium]
MLPVPIAATIMSRVGSIAYFFSSASIAVPSGTMLTVSMTPLVRVWVHSLPGDR